MKELPTGIEKLIDSKPLAFIQQIQERDLSDMELAESLDAINPHRSLCEPCGIRPMISFAGYPLKPAFKSETGWDKLMALSESKTLFLLALLKQGLGKQIHFITPEDSKQCAMLVFQVQGLKNVHEVEKTLKKMGFEIDTRPPNNIRVTAHYAYTSFVDIVLFVYKLKLAIDLTLKQEAEANTNPVSVRHHSVFRKDEDKQILLNSGDMIQAKL
jgi:hypothetical protein